MIKQVEIITRYHHFDRVCSVGRVTYSDMTYDYALIKGSVQVGNLVKVREHRKVRHCQCCSARQSFVYNASIKKV